MATTDVLLLKPIETLGGEGQQVTVKLGYARNYLLPRGFAIPANRANIKQIEALQKARDVREARELKDASAIAERINAINVGIPVKTGDGGKIFGSVTSQHLAARLEAEGLEVPRKKILLKNPIKELGRHEVEVRLHSDVSATLKFEIVSENPIEEDSEA